MASIPLDFQKRCEQRWVARFSRPDPTAPKKVGPESQQQQIEPDRAKGKSNGSNRPASGLHQRSKSAFSLGTNCFQCELLVRTLDGQVCLVVSTRPQPYFPFGWGLFLSGKCADPTDSLSRLAAAYSSFGAALAAGPVDEPAFDIGQPDMIRPVVGTDGDRAAAAVVGVVHEDPANAHLAHFAEADLLRAGMGGHAVSSKAAQRMVRGLFSPERTARPAFCLLPGALP